MQQLSSAIDSVTVRALARVRAAKTTAHRAGDCALCGDFSGTIVEPCYDSNHQLCMPCGLRAFHEEIVGAMTVLCPFCKAESTLRAEAASVSVRRAGGAAAVADDSHSVEANSLTSWWSPSAVETIVAWASSMINYKSVASPNSVESLVKWVTDATSVSSSTDKGPHAVIPLSDSDYAELLPLLQTAARDAALYHRLFVRALTSVTVTNSALAEHHTRLALCERVFQCPAPNCGMPMLLEKTIVEAIADLEEVPRPHARLGLDAVCPHCSTHVCLDCCLPWVFEGSIIQLRFPISHLGRSCSDFASSIAAISNGGAGNPPRETERESERVAQIEMERLVSIAALTEAREAVAAAESAAAALTLTLTPKPKRLLTLMIQLCVLILLQLHRERLNVLAKQ